MSDEPIKRTPRVEHENGRWRIWLDGRGPTGVLDIDDDELGDLITKLSEVARPILLTRALESVGERLSDAAGDFLNFMEGADAEAFQAYEDAHNLCRNIQESVDRVIRAFGTR